MSCTHTHRLTHLDDFLPALKPLILGFSPEMIKSDIPSGTPHSTEPSLSVFLSAVFNIYCAAAHQGRTFNLLFYPFQPHPNVISFCVLTLQQGVHWSQCTSWWRRTPHWGKDEVTVGCLAWCRKAVWPLSQQVWGQKSAAAEMQQNSHCVNASQQLSVLMSDEEDSFQDKIRCWREHNNWSIVPS